MNEAGAADDKAAPNGLGGALGGAPRTEAAGAAAGAAAKPLPFRCCAKGLLMVLALLP